MKLPIVCAALLLLALPVFSQLTENFEKGDRLLPPWHGTDTAWMLREGRLQSRCLQPDSRFWIRAPVATGLPAVWEWWMRLGFNTSSANYVEAYLLTDSSDLLQPVLAGYFVRIGGVRDEISLYRKGPDGTVLLVDGRDGATGRASSEFKIRVTCDDGHTWRLWTDSTGTGAHYTAQGAARDSSIRGNACFGIVVQQSTPRFFQQHFFDDVTVGPLARDTVPPALLLLTPLNAQELLLQFSEWVDSSTALQAPNYEVSGPVGRPAGIWLAADGLHLFFTQPFPEGDSLLLRLQGITDAAGNALPAQQRPFLYYPPRPYDVLVHELLLDPEPAAGLPPAEYIELRNVCPYPVQLQGWRLCTPNGAALLPACLLPPDSLLLLCRADKAPLFSGVAPVLALDGLPLLQNEGDTLWLSDAAGRVIHAVGYDKSWYADPLKENGGYSLEMISPQQPCLGAANWKAAAAPAGGTPGKPNSVAASPEGQPFADLLRVSVPDSITALLYFSQSLDSPTAADPARYRLDSAGSPGITSAAVLPPLFNTVRLQVSAPLQPAQVYTLTVNGLKDCNGQAAGPQHSAVLALPLPPGRAQVVISEVLADPAAPAPEFIELYNRGPGAVNLQQLYLALADDAGSPRQRIPVAAAGHLLLPGRHIALTPGPEALCSRYPCPGAGSILRMDNLPRLPDDAGTLLLYDAAGLLLDSIHYDRRLHFPLSAHTEGVSLERLGYESSSPQAPQWLAAAATAGYATPGNANSQRLPATEQAGEVTVQPAVFSPDHDGLDDMALITLRLPGPGFVGNITVFNAMGAPVCSLLQNGLLAAGSNQVVWNGLGTQGRTLPVGIYIIFTEIFDLEGRVRRWKLPVVMARKLN